MEIGGLWPVGFVPERRDTRGLPLPVDLLISFNEERSFVALNSWFAEVCPLLVVECTGEGVVGETEKIGGV